MVVCFQNSGTPKWMVFSWNTLFFDDLGVPLFLETSMGFHVKYYENSSCFAGAKFSRHSELVFGAGPSIYLLRKHPGRMPHPTYTHENQEVKQLMLYNLVLVNFRS